MVSQRTLCAANQTRKFYRELVNKDHHTRGNSKFAASQNIGPDRSAGGSAARTCTATAPDRPCKMAAIQTERQLSRCVGLG